MLAFVLMVICQADPPANIKQFAQRVKDTHVKRVAFVEKELATMKRTLADKSGAERKKLYARAKEQEKHLKELKKGNPDPDIVRMPVPPIVGAIGSIESARFRLGYIETGGSLPTASGPSVKYRRAIIRGVDTSNRLEGEQFLIPGVYKITGVEQIDGEQIPVYELFETGPWRHLWEKP